MAGSRSFAFLLLVVGIIGVNSYEDVEYHFDSDIGDGEESRKPDIKLDSDGRTDYYHYKVEHNLKSNNGPSNGSDKLERRNIDPKDLAAITKELKEARDAERARQNQRNAERQRGTIFDRLVAARGQAENAGNELRNMPMEFPGLNNNNW